MSTISSRKFGWAAALWLFTASAVHAHSPVPQFGEFYNGMLHPVFSLEHGAAVAGLALLAGQSGAARTRLTFATIVACAPIAWLLSPSFPVIGQIASWGLPLLLAIIGTIAALAWKPAAWLHVLLAGVTAVMVTATTSDHPAEHGWLRFTGLMVAIAFLSVTIGAVIVKLHQKEDWRKIAVRVVGSWIGTLGAILLALRA